MPEQRPTDVFSGLPRTRPHRRSDKRPSARAEVAATEDTAAAAGEAKPRDGTAKKPPAKRAPAARSAAAKPTQRKRRPKPEAEPAAVPEPPAAKRASQPKRRRTPRAETLRQPPQPAGTPTPPRSRKPVPATGAEILGTTVQAIAELTEIGLSAGARALRNAVSRLPRP